MKLAKHAYIDSQVLCVLQLYILCFFQRQLKYVKSKYVNVISIV